MSRLTVGLAAALLASTKLFAAETLHFALHIVPAEGEPCEEMDWTDFTCAAIELVGDNATAQRVYLLYTGVDSLAWAEFGVFYSVDYDDDAIGDWTFCTEPTMASTRPPWPAGASHASATWIAPGLTAPADSILVLGAIEISPGAAGSLSAWVGGHSGLALAVTIGGSVHAIGYGGAEERFGIVSLDGAPGRPVHNPCRQIVPTRRSTWSTVKSLYR